MEKNWAGTTYGSVWLLKSLIWLLKYTNVRLPYIFSAVFVIPICLLVNPSCGIIYRYFRLHHHYGRLKAAYKTYINHCNFGQVIIDKFAMYAGQKFHVEVQGYEHFQSLANRDEGFVLLSSHVGNYEIAGYTLKSTKKAFNALVFYGEKAIVMENRTKLFSETNIRMIAIRPDMGHLFEIDEALQNGDIVSMPADRIFGSQKKLQRQFLGSMAEFPVGPFSVATMRSLDVLAVHVVKESYKKYKIFVTPLTYDKTAPRKEQIEELSSNYVSELERIVKSYPTQWYNYFEFWDTAKD